MLTGVFKYSHTAQIACSINVFGISEDYRSNINSQIPGNVAVATQLLDNPV